MTQANAASREALLREALLAVRADIMNENGLNGEAIACTVWHGNCETTVDFIDAMLALADEAASQPREGVALDAYDAGLLGDGGGGDVDWWQDYIRAELDRAHEFYADQVAALHDTAPTDQAQRGEVERLRDIAKRIDLQATCLEGYAESSGHAAKPVPSVFHFQATHFRDLASEIRAALAQSGKGVE